MTVALKFCVGILLLWLAAVQADVSHLGYRHYKGQRLRLQRFEAEPTPYPAAGFRPIHEFNLPHNRPLFPLDNQHDSRPFGSSTFNDLGETARPQLTYGSPQPEPRFRSQNRPQKFNSGEEPQDEVFIVRYHQRQQPTQAPLNHFDRPQQTHNNGFDNFAEDQQYNLEEQATIASQERTEDSFNNLAQPQQPEVLYGAPNSQEQEAAQSARLKQQLVARLHQTKRFEKIQQQPQHQRQQSESQRYRQQQFVNAPQNLYSAPLQQFQLQAASQTRHIIAPKPARLTDNREETEPDTDAKIAESEEIETTTKTEGKKTVTQTIPAAGVTPVVANNGGVVSYYPASAVGFVQPLNAAAYVASVNYPTVQTFPAAYTVGAPYLPQQYAFAAAPAAPLKVW